MAGGDTLEYAAFGQPRRATLKEVPRLAWMLSLASTSRYGSILAPFVYLSNVEGLRHRVSVGGVWHSEARMVLLTMPVGGPNRAKMPMPWWLPLAALTGFIILSLVNQTLADTLFMLAIIVSVLMALPTLVMLPNLLSPATRRADVAIKHWSKSSQSQAYVLSCLVKDRRVEWGAGVPFVEDVFRAAHFPPGTPVAVVAGNDKQARFLRALGFKSLEHDGVPTRAMARTI